MSTGMKAAVFAGPESVRIEERDIPLPGPGQVRIALEGCGVCASNLPVWEGRPWFSYPLEPGAPGHEGWGMIDAVGDGVDHLSEGERVTALSYHAYSTHDIAAADSVVRLPSGFDSLPAPGEPLGCAVNIIRRSDIHPEHTVAIVGIGFQGALLTVLAAAAGARVIAVSRRDFALETALKAGASESVSMMNPSAAIERIMELTDGEGCERVIEAAGVQETLDFATGIVRVGGKLVVAGYHQDGLRTVNMQIWNWRGIDVINAHERDSSVCIRGIRDAIGLAGNGFDPSSLYTHRLPLEELPRAFELMRRRPSGFMKALVMMEGMA